MRAMNPLKGISLAAAGTGTHSGPDLYLFTILQVILDFIFAW